MRKAAEALDHVLLGAPTLEAGIAWLEDRTGVRAMMGGSHPGLGTWNALASLGPAQYVEVIAPDPAQPGVDTFYVPGLRDFVEPRIAAWAARLGNLRHFTSAPPKALLCEPLGQGSRVRPDGTRLAWSLAFPKDRERGTFGGALPFLIEWDEASAHPGGSAPSGLRLRSISIGHPDQAALNGALEALDIEGAAREEKAASIRIELETPKGVVIL